MKRKLMLSLILLIVGMLLSACGASDEEKLYEKLEETIEIENSTDATKQVTELEIKNKEHLNNIAKYTDDELDEIKKESEAAIEVNQTLKDNLEQEKETIEEAKKEFEASESIIENLEEAKEKDLALKLYEVMMDRYSTYDKYNKEYEVAIDERIHFYEIMKDKEAEEEKVLQQVEQINKHNEEVIKLNKLLNEQIEQYNSLKKDLYAAMDLKVEYED